MNKKIGIIQADETVLCDDGTIYTLPRRGMHEYLFDAKEVGGDGWMHRQSVIPYIGFKVEFYTNNNKYGYDFCIKKQI